jgi:UDP-glucose 4-epimerase
MAILITGGTGFVGPYVARKLIDEGEDKLILFDFIPNPTSVGDIAEHVEIIQGDVTEPFELMAVLKQHEISCIFHLAYILGPEAETAPSRSMRINILGTYNVFEAARRAGVKRVIWASSAGAYGTIETSNKVQLLREEDRPMPITLYGASKLFNEHVAEILARNYGFDHICLCLSSIYGLGRAQRRSIRPDIYWGLIEQSARGEEVRVPPGDHLVNWSYVKDCADAFYHAYKADKPKSRLFNFTGEIRPVKDAVDYVKTLFPKARVTMGSKGERTLPYLDGSRIRSELGFEPRYTMEKGIKDYIDLLSHRRT